MSHADAVQAGSMPVADGIPVLGSALYMLKNPLEFLKTQTKKHGPVFRVMAGPRSMTILSGIDAGRFMTEEGKDCFVSDSFWGRLTGAWDCPHMITAMDGEEHISDRKMMKSTMSKKVADDHQSELVDIVHMTMRRYLEKSPTLSVRDLTRTLTNSELYLLLTDEYPDLDEGTARSLAEYQRITFNVLMLGKWPKLMFWTPQYLYHKWRAERFIRELMSKFEDRPPEDGFFKVVLELQKRPNRTEGDLLANFFAPFWAGLDTLGASMTFLFRELLENPQLMAATVAEIKVAVVENNGAIPAPDKLRAMPKLFGLCMEVLRKYPVAFGNGRTAAKDFEFGGYHIAKGEDVLVFTTATHFDEAYFPDPEKFDPMRYSGVRNEHRKRFAFNPYGRGAHICLGAAMAETMFLTTVAVLLNDYQFEAANPGKRYDMIFDPSPTLPSGFKMKVAAAAQL